MFTAEQTGGPSISTSAEGLNKRNRIEVVTLTRMDPNARTEQNRSSFSLSNDSERENRTEQNRKEQNRKEQNRTE
jgi:hypothetical protein